KFSKFEEIAPTGTEGVKMTEISEFTAFEVDKKGNSKLYDGVERSRDFGAQAPDPTMVEVKLTASTLSAKAGLFRVGDELLKKFDQQLIYFVSEVAGVTP